MDKLEYILEKISQLFSEMTDLRYSLKSFSNPTEIITQIDNIENTLTTNLSEVQQLKNSLQQLNQTVSSIDTEGIINDINKNASDIVNLTNNSTTFQNSITNQVNSLETSFNNNLTNLQNGLIEDINEVETNLTNTINSTETLLTEQINQVEDNTLSAITEIENGVADSIATITQQIDNKVLSSQNTLNAKIESVEDSVTSQITTLTQNLTNLDEELSQSINNTTTSLTQQIENVNNSCTASITTLSQDLEDNVSALQTSISQNTTNLSTLEQSTTQFKNSANQAINTLNTKVENLDSQNLSDRITSNDLDITNLLFSTNQLNSTFNSFKQEVQNQINKINSNKNILINPNFKVNQNGKTLYRRMANDNEMFYTVDMFASAAGTLEDNEFDLTHLSTGGIKIKGYGECDFLQIIENGKNLYLNKPLSLSISVDGTIYTKENFSVTTNGIQSLTFPKGSVHVINSGDIFKCVLKANANTEFVVNWWKLEEGEKVTPFVEPKEEEEFLKCSRYYTVLRTVPNDIQLNDYLTTFCQVVEFYKQDGIAYPCFFKTRFSFDLPTEMRTFPKLKYFSNFKIFNTRSGEYEYAYSFMEFVPDSKYNNDGVRVISYQKNRIFIEGYFYVLDEAGIGDIGTYTQLLSRENVYLHFDANLYE